MCLTDKFLVNVGLIYYPNYGPYCDMSAANVYNGYSADPADLFYYSQMPRRRDRRRMLSEGSGMTDFGGAAVDAGGRPTSVIDSLFSMRTRAGMKDDEDGVESNASFMNGVDRRELATCVLYLVSRPITCCVCGRDLCLRVNTYGRTFVLHMCIDSDTTTMRRLLSGVSVLMMGGSLSLRGHRRRPCRSSQTATSTCPTKVR
jgi:hypothetical protein